MVRMTNDAAAGVKGEDLTDFEDFELRNVASETAYGATVLALHAQLRNHFESDEMISRGSRVRDQPN